MSTALTTAQRAELGALLIARMATLEEEIAAQEGAGGRVAAAAELLDDSRAGGVQREADREVALQRTSQAHGELQRVRDALDRLESPGFGLCSACGEAIGMPRLQAKPWTRHCVACERQRELGQPTPPRL